jgi:hypothetical protein
MTLDSTPQYGISLVRRLGNGTDSDVVCGVASIDAAGSAFSEWMDAITFFCGFPDRQSSKVDYIVFRTSDQRVLAASFHNIRPNGLPIQLADVSSDSMRHALVRLAGKTNDFTDSFVYESFEFESDDEDYFGQATLLDDPLADNLRIVIVCCSFLSQQTRE